MHMNLECPPDRKKSNFFGNNKKKELRIGILEVSQKKWNKKLSFKRW